MGKAEDVIVLRVMVDDLREADLCKIWYSIIYYSASGSVFQRCEFILILVLLRPASSGSCVVF